MQREAERRGAAAGSRSAQVIRQAALALALWSAVPVQTAAPALHFPAADPAAIARWIGPPPVAGSPAAQREVASMLAAQARRTSADCAAANAAAELSLFDPFASVLGAGATAAAFPATTRFLDALANDTFTVTAVAKSEYHRSRPNAVDPAIHPCISQPESLAYPSGHGVFIYTVAEAFAALVPERRDAIFAAATTFADQRVIAGIHYPSDAAASRTAAALYYAFASTDPAFAPAFDAARRELRTGLKLP